ncbi:iron-containing alcohol dehydrogenase [Clostridium sp. DL-VIII]|uniref:iron-containing alcohol dehydrogenase n=1 Tax=Clostridium sp. DL-VIII TaxID=641107 RepID=UPI000A00685C
MKVYFGEDADKKALGVELGKVGKTVMLVYGEGSVKKNGVYDELVQLLTEAGKEVVDFSGIMLNPTYVKVQEGVKLVKEKNVDFILAVGGRFVIDCCKVVSAQATLEEDIWDMEYKPGEFLITGILMGAVITYEDKMWKGPIVGSCASFAIYIYTIKYVHFNITINLYGD